MTTPQSRDRFLQESFECIAKFFENSLASAKTANTATNWLLRILNAPIYWLHPGSLRVQTNFNRTDSYRFEAMVEVGRTVNQCEVGFGKRNGQDIDDIYISHSSFNPSSGDHNGCEWLTAASSKNIWALKPVGDSVPGSERNRTLSPNDAAKYFWGIFRK